MAASALMLAHQVAGKVVRDGLFLSRFPASDLPKIVAGAAIVAVLLGLAFSRALSRYGPRRLAPIAFAVGAVLHLVEYALLLSGGDSIRPVVITVVYLHLVGFGAILLSGFWSIVNEFFDPREAKQHFGRITGAGTVGGVAGGLLAERGAALFGVDSLLLLLAALYMATAFTLFWAPRSEVATHEKPETGPFWSAAQDAFQQAPFLVNLAVLVLFGTMSAALLDYIFKSSATAQFGRGPMLTRYFAIFYTVNQVLSFLVQTFLTPIVLRRSGLGRTVRWHPAAVAAGSVASLLGPQTFTAPVARGLELVLRGSFLRSGYELFFTPVPPREKRAVKTFIDVGCDRMGDALGALVLQMLLFLGPQQALDAILLTALVLAALSLRITGRMDAAYSKVLEHGLLNRAIAMDEARVQDSTTLSALMRTSFQPRAGAAVPAERPAENTSIPSPAAPATDAVVARLRDLRSGDAKKVAAALSPELPFDPLLAPQAIRLLGWTEVLEWPVGFLVLNGHRMVGQLIDALLDPEQDFAVRRRIPRILAHCSSQRAVSGLTRALEDSRFEIRYHASRALEFLHRGESDLHFDQEAVRAALMRELSTSRALWNGRKLLDRSDDHDEQYWFLDSVLKDRADKSLEHVFSLMALELPEEPLKASFRALHGDDRMLRALALEYLEANLPHEIASQLTKLVDPGPAGAVRRPPQEVLEDLMASQVSILESLKIPSAGVPGQGE